MKHSKWKRSVLLVALSGALSLMASGQALAVDKALIVGVGKYRLSQANLPGIDLDVNMAKDMAVYMGIRPENVRVVMDEQATLSRVREEMRNWLGQGVSSGDRVFFYYSGHGTQVKDKNSDEEDGLDEAMVLHDIDGKTQQGLYVDDDFGADLKNIPSQNMVVMVDACHSGTGTKNVSFTGGNSFNVHDGKYKYLDLFHVQPEARKKDLGVTGMSDGAVSGVDNYLSLAAAQDNQQSIATGKGSLFTVAFRDSFDSERGKPASPTLKSIYQATEAKLKDSGVDFQPNMSGNKEIAERALRVADNGGEGTTRNGPLWQDISGLVDQMPRLQISAPATRSDGESTEFVVDVPSDGYLNIVMIGPRDNGTVLFPNSYNTDNRVSAGRLNFPTAQMPFKIKAQPPYGKTLVAAFVTKERVNLMEDGFGNRDSSGKSVKPFAHVTRGGMRSLTRGTRDLGVSAKDEREYWGGKSEIDIRGR